MSSLAGAPWKRSYGHICRKAICGDRHAGAPPTASFRHSSGGIIPGSWFAGRTIGPDSRPNESKQTRPILTISIKNIVDLRRALSDDRALRRLHAKENDELQAHMEREVARTFIQIMPALAVIAIFAGALVSLEAMAAAAATLVFLSVALLVVKLSYKIRLQGEIGDDVE